MPKLQQFGIVSVNMGIKEDYPAIFLPDGVMSDGENSTFRYGRIERSKGRLKELVTAAAVKAPAPDGNPILKYHYHVKATTGTGYLCAFTKAHIYYWSPATNAYVSKFTCASNCTEWSTVSYNDKIVATNNVDKVLVWNCGAGNFVPIDDSTDGIEYSSGVYLTKAKCVAEYERYLVVGNVTEAGTNYPSRIRWCALGDENNWLSGDASYGDLEGSDPLCGFGKKESRFYIFKEEHIHVIWLVSSSAVFNKVIFNTKVGSKAMNSIINSPDGKLYFFATDYTFREIDEGEISSTIDPTVKEINPEYLHSISAAYSSRYNHLLWSIPYGSSSTDNTLVVIYNKGRWEKRNVAVTSLGEFERSSGQKYTWDTLPYSSWDTWAWDIWNTTESGTDFPVVLAGDSVGNTFDFYGGETDDTAAYTGYFVLATDLSRFKKAVTYKRLLLMQLYFKSGSGSVNIYVKRDSEIDWQSAGSVALTGTSEFVIKDLPCDYRAKNYYIKISGAVPFKFVGIFFKYFLAGDR